MYRVVLLTVAKADVKEAASWYEDKQDKLGKKILADVRQITGLIRRKSVRDMLQDMMMLEQRF